MSDPQSQPAQLSREAELDRVMHELRAEVSDLRRQLLRTQDEQARRTLRALDRPSEDFRSGAADQGLEELATATASVAALEQELASLRSVADARALRIEQVSAELDTHRALVQELVQSRSWRLTRPVRILGRLAKSGRLRAR